MVRATGITVDCKIKFAVTVVSVETVKLHGEVVDVHVPAEEPVMVQPVNVEPDCADAVKVTVVPPASIEEQEETPQAAERCPDHCLMSQLKNYTSLEYQN